MRCSQPSLTCTDPVRRAGSQSSTSGCSESRDTLGLPLPSQLLMAAGPADDHHSSDEPRRCSCEERECREVMIRDGMFLYSLHRSRYQHPDDSPSALACGHLQAATKFPGTASC